MQEPAMLILIIINAIGLILIFMLFQKLSKSKVQDVTAQLAVLENSLGKLERNLAEAEARNRAETNANTRALREELTNSLNRFNESLLTRLHEDVNTQLSQLDSFAKQLQALTTASEQKADKLREDVNLTLNTFKDAVQTGMREMNALQIKQLESFSNQLQAMMQTIEQRLKSLQEENSVKMQEMRQTLDSRLEIVGTQLRETMAKSLRDFTDSIGKQMNDSAQLQLSQSETLVKNLQMLSTANEQRIERLRDLVDGQLKAIQEENGKKLEEVRRTVDEKLTGMSTLQVQQLESFANQLHNMMQTNDQRLKSLQEENGVKMQEMRQTLDSRLETVGTQLRDTLGKSLKDFTDSTAKQMNDHSQLQLTQSENLVKNLQLLSTANEQRMDKLREQVENQLKAIQEDNAKKLEEMRRTVDEKLNETLEKRLGESFKLVSERLEQVHKGLGEMQTLASGVGDLKRVLTNVKTRGIWGELHLGNLLEQVLTPEQYSQNVATKPGSNDRVEFAIKLPGRDKQGTHVWLPIDAKFPQEDYQRLLDAQEAANPALADEAAKALETRIKSEAKDIATKYISPPHTTEFAILFLPVEGLYAEVLRRPGLCDTLMRDFKVVIAGPTTLAALLNSLQMGFRTLAIEKRSSEVWALLGAVKTEFGKFGTLLDKTGKKLQEASNSIDDAARRSRAIERKLRDVQELPQAEAVMLLAATNEEVE